MRVLLLTGMALNLVGCSSTPAEPNNKAYDVTREERLYNQCVGQVSDLTSDNRKVITVDGSIRAVSGCVGVAKQIR